MRKSRHKRISKEVILSMFIAFIMIASILGYTMLEGDSAERRTYGKFVLVQTGNYWAMKVNGISLDFYYLPEELKDIEVSDEILQSITDTYEVDITSDLNDTNAEGIALMQHGLEQVLDVHKIFLRRGFTSENEYGLPVIGCEDATSAVPVLRIITSDETAVFREGSCILVTGAAGSDFVRLRDKLGYGILGIKVD